MESHSAALISLWASPFVSQDTCIQADASPCCVHPHLSPYQQDHSTSYERLTIQLEVSTGQQNVSPGIWKADPKKYYMEIWRSQNSQKYFEKNKSGGLCFLILTHVTGQFEGELMPSTGDVRTTRYFHIKEDDSFPPHTDLLLCPLRLNWAFHLVLWPIWVNFYFYFLALGIDLMTLWWVKFYIWRTG